ncbi:MAG: type I-C CRISPR-associated protein Cas5c [Verrucomicrobia bacterium]|nr:type I-C CRISPR-associated protein Cas5c [Verrucomicrobiota bacterium]
MKGVEFKVTGRHALFTDPVTRMGGEKCSYHIPTYEALKGILKSVYWKPTLIWIIDEVRVMKPIRTQVKSVKPLNYGGIYPSQRDPVKKQEPFNTLAMYTYLSDVEYQVRAHFEWNMFRDDMACDRNDGKHCDMARRMVKKGGRRDIFLGARECQGYVEPCSFGEGKGAYDEIDRLDYGVMFHGFDYPDETGKTDEEGKSDEAGAFRLHSRFWKPAMKRGIIQFIRPEECSMRKLVREMIPHPPQSIGLKEETIQNELD